MVNGTTSRVVYVIAGVLAVAAIAVIALLTIDHDPVPGDIEYTLFGCLGFILGTHFKPPISTDGNGAELAPDQKAA